MVGWLGGWWRRGRFIEVDRVMEDVLGDVNRPSSIQMVVVAS